MIGQCFGQFLRWKSPIRAGDGAPVGACVGAPNPKPPNPKPLYSLCNPYSIVVSIFFSNNPGSVDGWVRASILWSVYIVIGVIQGLFRDDGKYKGNYYSIIGSIQGLHGDDGK